VLGRIPQLLREANLPSEALLQEMTSPRPIFYREWMMIARQEDSGFGGRIDVIDAPGWRADPPSN
jgi:hypothetical protein